jgi:hypothetical protein
MDFLTCGILHELPRHILLKNNFSLEIFLFLFLKYFF